MTSTVSNKRFAIGTWQNRAYNNNNGFLILNFEHTDVDYKSKIYICVLAIIDHYIIKFGRAKKIVLLEWCYLEDEFRNSGQNVEYDECVAVNGGLHVRGGGGESFRDHLKSNNVWP